MSLTIIMITNKNTPNSYSRICTAFNHWLFNSSLPANNDWQYWWPHFHFRNVNMTEMCKSQPTYNLLYSGRKTCSGRWPFHMLAPMGSRVSERQKWQWTGQAIFKTLQNNIWPWGCTFSTVIFLSGFKLPSSAFEVLTLVSNLAIPVRRYII